MPLCEMSNAVAEPSSPLLPYKVWKPECEYSISSPFHHSSMAKMNIYKYIGLISVYRIQLEAPTPNAIIRKTDIDATPDFYGYEYHGIMDHKTSEKLLCDKCDGSYLVRRSPGATDYYTLSMRFANRTKHYKIYFKSEWGHFLKEDFKRFESIHDLVADGLVNFYMQIHAAPIIQSMMSQTKQNYQQSPYMTLNRRKLRALSNDLRKSLKIDVQNNECVSVQTLNSPTTNNAVKRLGENVNLTNTVASSAQEEVDVLPVVYQKSHKFKIHTFKGLNWVR